jgi:hypothetical protein
VELGPAGLGLVLVMWIVASTLIFLATVEHEFLQQPEFAYLLQGLQ